jgi:hypothetical protein
VSLPSGVEGLTIINWTFGWSQTLEEPNIPAGSYRSYLVQLVEPIVVKPINALGIALDIKPPLQNTLFPCTRPHEAASTSIILLRMHNNDIIAQ